MAFNEFWSDPKKSAADVPMPGTLRGALPALEMSLYQISLDMQLCGFIRVSIRNHFITRYYSLSW